MNAPSILRPVSVVALLGLAACSPQAKQDDGFPPTVDVGTRPESIVKGFDGDYFVTLMGGQEAGDGSVVRISDGVVSPFATGLDEPKGIAFDGTHLYATDVTRVWKIDASGQASELAVEKDFPAAISFLNDAAMGPDRRSLFVTDMGATRHMSGPDGMWPLDSEEAKNIPVKGHVFEIALDSGAVRIAAGPSPLMPCPNGVAFGKEGQLLMGDFFRGSLLEQRDGELAVIAEGFRGADGVEQDAAGNYYLSSWNQAKLWKIDGQTKEAKLLIEGLESAADFYLNETAGYILLPDMGKGTILRIDLSL